MSYENFSYYYDSLMDPAFYNDYIDFINKHAKFQSVLELGCGTGEVAIRLAKQNKSVVATDLSDDMLYILDENDVKKVLMNAYQALKMNGTFIFDVDSLYKCNVILNDYHEESHDDDFDFCWDVKSDGAGSIEHHVVIIDRENDDCVDEIHHQKTLPVHVYGEMLKKAGFSYTIFSDFNSYKEECERLIFVCKKEM
ncbi:class I SAM-dependent methyltransferase [uncultured Sharpea sp.]|uniref:class I SAM-dependent methyltransferase n=1 Tax=uncultured Sharpea sp. TaxID=1112738 RepID=UPI0025908C28|nr:class I SAM-dependent methyltransferase [uncultured Sharpea sp.]